MWNIILNNLPTIITLLLGLTIIWTRLAKLLVVISELQQLLSVFTAAMADKQLSPQECKDLSKEAQDLYEAVKNLLKK